MGCCNRCLSPVQMTTTLRIDSDFADSRQRVSVAFDYGLCNADGCSFANTGEKVD